MPYADEEKRRSYARDRWPISGPRNRELKRLKRQNVAYAIFSDCKKADRKFGRDNDLDMEFVQQSIAVPCTYCGGVKLRMTLDRVDNSLGHLKGNVVPACERCNYVRRDMPHAAWLVVARAMREATENGLFGNWTGSIHRRDGEADEPSAG